MGYKLFYPAEDYSTAFDLSDGQLELIRWIAKRGGEKLVYREDPVNKKIYLRHPNDGRKAVPAPTAEDKAATAKASKIWLPTTYQAQYDSNTAEGYRMCWSSTGAMLAEAFKPGVLQNHPKRYPGEQLDDFYLRIVQVILGGDTTKPPSHLAAMKWLGITAHYAQDGDYEKLVSLLNKGVRVGCGVLHHGYFTAPSGGGHWMCLNGYKENGDLICCDPAGKMDLQNGGYPGLGSGSNVAYNKQQWLSRWMPQGSPGWYFWLY